MIPKALIATATKRRASNIGRPPHRLFRWRCKDSTNGLDYTGAEALPCELFSANTRLLTHQNKLSAMSKCPVDALRDQFGLAGLDDEALDTVVDEVSGCGAVGREDRKAAGERLKQNLSEAFPDPREDEHIRRLIGGDQFGGADRGPDLDL